MKTKGEITDSSLLSFVCADIREWYDKPHNKDMIQL